MTSGTHDAGLDHLEVLDQHEGYEVVHERCASFYNSFDRKPEMQHQTHYCPGCGHGVAHKLVAEAIAELGLQDRTILVSPVGCSVFAYYYFDVGNVQVAHGRAPAAATALKRSRPGSIVISYQGDGDLAAIGTAEIIHAANRGEHIAVFFVNNAIYGMTGGQMAPTTLVHQKSTTTPWGRHAEGEGYPLHLCEMLSTLHAPIYIERVALSDGKHIMQAQRAVRKALDLQNKGAGFTFVEVLSPCPTVWGKDPVEARKWVTEKLMTEFPVGVYRDRGPEPVEPSDIPQRNMMDVLELHEKKSTSKGARHHELHGMGIKVAGFGGQGVLLLGSLLAEMGMREGHYVSWLPSYGPEMRSGSAHCHVCLSDEPIGSPLLTRPKVLVAMNEVSLRKFAPSVPKDGLILYAGEHLPEEFELPAAPVLCIPAAQIADGIGSPKVANMAMLGALLAETECLSPETALETLGEKVKRTELIAMNRKAIEAGAARVAAAKARANQPVVTV